MCTKAKMLYIYAFSTRGKISSGRLTRDLMEGGNRFRGCVGEVIL